MRTKKEIEKKIKFFEGFTKRYEPLSATAWVFQAPERKIIEILRWILSKPKEAPNEMVKTKRRVKRVDLRNKRD